MKFFIWFLFFGSTPGALSQTKVSMTIIINSKNHIYYYENELATDAANFKIGELWIIKDFSLWLEKENGKENVSYILKVENKDSLNEVSTNLVNFLKAKPHFKQSKISKTEKTIVDSTEKVNAQH
jgi:hypothetical protein